MYFINLYETMAVEVIIVIVLPHALLVYEGLMNALIMGLNNTGVDDTQDGYHTMLVILKGRNSLNTRHII